MNKFWIAIAAGFFLAIAAIKGKISIAGLYNTFGSVTGVYPTKGETVAFLCLGFASILCGHILRGWMKGNGHRKWKRMAGSALLTFALLLSSWSIIVWLSHAKDQTVLSEEDKMRRDKLREKLQKAKRGDTLFLEGEDLHQEMLPGIRFKKAKLKGANLEMAMLAGADLRGADLEYANLKQAMLMGANLSKAHLVNTNFEQAMLLGAQLEGAHIDGANFRNTAFLTQDQLDQACGKPRALPEELTAPKPC